MFVLFWQVTSVSWKENELNMVDTPGHADFGGEVCFHFTNLWNLDLYILSNLDLECEVFIFKDLIRTFCF